MSTSDSYDGEDEDILPTSVLFERESRTLRIEWESDDASVIDWTDLRLACPCAQCQGEDGTEQPNRQRILRSPAETDVTGAVMMGQYAVQPVWASGHDTGIYTWRLLRELARETDPEKPD